MAAVLVALRACAALVLCTAALAAQANDRPFLSTTNAVLEDDDDASWAVETWYQTFGRTRALTVAPEYSFDPHQSLQLLFTKLRERGEESPPSTLEFEYKYVLNNIARDGYGIGLHASLNTEDSRQNGWRSQRLAGRFLFSLPFRDGDAMLHLNAGIGKSRGEKRELVGSLVFEHKLPWRTHAFVELGREERENLLHAGVRHWVKKERFAVDFSVQQLRSDGRRENGFVIGLGWYDL